MSPLPGMHGPAVGPDQVAAVARLIARQPDPDDLAGSLGIDPPGGTMTTIPDPPEIEPAGHHLAGVQLTDHEWDLLVEADRMWMRAAEHRDPTGAPGRWQQAGMVVWDALTEIDPDLLARLAATRTAGDRR